MSIHNQNVKEYLSGSIEHITYHNTENGFCVLRVKVKNHKDLVTITGNLKWALCPTLRNLNRKYSETTWYRLKFSKASY